MKPEFNEIKGQLQNFRTLKIINFQIAIRDNYAVAVFSEPSFARKMVRQEIKKGNKNIVFSEKVNGVVEKFPGLNKEEITKLMGKKLRNAGAKIQK